MLSTRFSRRYKPAIIVCVLFVFLSSVIPVSAVSILDLEIQVAGMSQTDWKIATDLSKIRVITYNEEMAVDKSSSNSPNDIASGQESSDSPNEITGGQETSNSPIDIAGIKAPERAAEQASSERHAAQDSEAPTVDDLLYAKKLSLVTLDLSIRHHVLELEERLFFLGESRFASLESVGNASSGRSIWHLKVGSGEKKVLLNGGLHARETPNPLYLIRFATELLQAAHSGQLFYGQDAMDLLNEYTFCLLPLANPDGYEAVQYGDPYFSKAKSNLRLVDLNRNFPSYSAGIVWPGKSKINLISHKPAISYYAGPTLGSEPETQALIRWMNANVNATTHLFIDFHSGGSIVYDTKPDMSAERNAMSLQAGSIFRRVSGYARATDETTGQGTDGSITDYMYGLSYGMQFNPTIGRLAPQTQTELITKLNGAPVYDFAILTVETLKRGITSAPLESTIPSTGSGHPTLGDQAAEWTRAHFPEAILATLRYR